MPFAEEYLTRYAHKTQTEVCFTYCDTIICIPAYKEPKLENCIESLLQCLQPQKKVLILALINHSEAELPEIKTQSLIQYEYFAQKYNTYKSAWCEIKIMLEPNMPQKHAGVGLARKILMDYATSIFNQLQKPNGIIVNLDADCTVSANYLIEIENYFTQNPQTNGASIYYEHPTQGTEFSETIYTQITEYELHLRYYVEALRSIRYPYAYHTIGSAFAVRAKTYIQQNGMNRKKAGEDFYFLQKIIPLGHFGEINTCTVNPSPRISDRVPFGTGAAIRKQIEDAKPRYYTYNHLSFTDLEYFFKIIKTRKSAQYIQEIERELSQTENPIGAYALKDNALEDINIIFRNTATDEMFHNKLYQHFNAFWVMKYLNWSNEHIYNKIPVEEACNNFFGTTQNTTYWLHFLRNKQKNTFYVHSDFA